jgi:hypothetical protein
MNGTRFGGWQEEIGIFNNEKLSRSVRNHSIKSKKNYNPI